MGKYSIEQIWELLGEEHNEIQWYSCYINKSVKANGNIIACGFCPFHGYERICNEQRNYLKLKVEILKMFPNLLLEENKDENN